MLLENVSSQKHVKCESVVYIEGAREYGLSDHRQGVCGHFGHQGHLVLTVTAQTTECHCAGANYSCGELG